MEGVFHKRMYKEGHQHDVLIFGLVMHRNDFMH
jgi:hypothetical protein